MFVLSSQNFEERVNAMLRALCSAVPRRRVGRGRLASDLPTRPDAPTLFIECTHTYRGDLNTGIPRVVRNVLRNAAASAARHGYAVVPVILENNRLVPADLNQVFANKAVASHGRNSSANVQGSVRGLAQRGWRLLLGALSVVLPFTSAQRFLFASPDQFGFAWCLLLPFRALRIRPWPPLATEISLDAYPSCEGSILVLLDSSWHYPIWKAVKRFKQKGGKVVGVIYDLIPITHPHNSSSNLTFRAWMHKHIQHTDAFIGISRSTAEQVAQFLATTAKRSRSPFHPVAIDHFHLGSELDFVQESEPRPEIKQIFDIGRHMFLMVGSFEPRKNHSYVLDAFDTHWAGGGDAALVMIGRQTSKTEAFLERAANHKQLNRLLFLVRDATDTDLDYAYRSASALIIASEIEGFGLPIGEAFQRGLPVLCSDIPVFREIADGKATFFDLSHSNRLSDALTVFCRSHDVEQRGARVPQSWMTWRESTDQLCAAIVRALTRYTARAALPSEGNGGR